MTDKTDIAAQLSKRILHYADMASCTSEGTSVLGADLLKLIGDTINDLIGKLEVVSKSEWKLAGELVELQMTFNALQKKDNSCTLGVGEGSGRLFVHGDYESIKATQKIIIERDALRGDQVPVAWLNDAHLARGHIEGEAGEEDAGPGMIPVYREKYLPPQKPVISKEKLCDWLEDNFDIEDSQRAAFAQCFSHHCNCIVKDGD